MLPSSLSRSSNPWHKSPPAIALLDQLAPTDVRLIVARGGPGPDGLVWYPMGEFGATTFDALAALREMAIGPAFSMAPDDNARTTAIAIAQLALSVSGAVALRFGDPRRWLGYNPIDATRRFRANWT